MTDAIKFELPDLQAFLAELHALPQQVQQRLAKGAVATGASVIRKAAIALAPMDTGVLKGAIYQTRLVDQCTPTLEAWAVDVYAGKLQRHRGKKTSKFGPTQGTNRDAFYAKWIEYGHFTRTPAGPGPRKARREAARKAGTARWVPPQPFMGPAFRDHKDAAVRAMGEYITANLPAATAANRFLKAA